jgi:hypothetical protein
MFRLHACVFNFAGIYLKISKWRHIRDGTPDVGHFSSTSLVEMEVTSTAAEDGLAEKGIRTP